jgi:hypothetical protein
MADQTVASPAVPAPRLKATHRPLWRDATTVQLGLLPEHATVLGDMSVPTARLLAALDRGRRAEPTGPADEALLHALGLAQALELPPVDLAARLVPERTLLSLVHPAPGAADAALAARRATRVLVLGGGRVGAAVAHVLAASGIGRVGVEDRTPVDAADACPGGVSVADVGLRRGAAATAVAVRASPPVLDDGPPDVLVVCPDGAAPPDAARWWPALQRGTALLVATVREGTGIVGPLTLPYGQCCPGCLSRHRADRDPAWPLMERQLADPDRAPAAAAAATTVLAVAATAAEQLLSWIDVRGTREAVVPASVGATLELPRPGWRWQRRPWGPHPECHCSTLTASAS